MKGRNEDIKEESKINNNTKERRYSQLEDRTWRQGKQTRTFRGSILRKGQTQYSNKMQRNEALNWQKDNGM